jgi:hypothetical protein
MTSITNHDAHDSCLKFLSDLNLTNNRWSKIWPRSGLWNYLKYCSENIVNDVFAPSGQFDPIRNAYLCSMVSACIFLQVVSDKSAGIWPNYMSMSCLHFFLQFMACSGSEILSNCQLSAQFALKSNLPYCCPSGRPCYVRIKNGHQFWLLVFKCKGWQCDSEIYNIHERAFWMMLIVVGSGLLRWTCWALWILFDNMSCKLPNWVQWKNNLM